MTQDAPGTKPHQGLSGTLTHVFITSPLTPLLLLVAVMLGALALFALPREEEPQISVPMVDIIVQANGYRADEAVELVTRPLEDLVKGINGVEHVYSQSQDDRVMVTARFLVGTDQDSAILRVHEKIRAHIGELPKGLPEPMIVGRGIDDVAIAVLSLSAKPEAAGRYDANALSQIAEDMRHDLTKIDNIGATTLVGGTPSQIRVEPDPEKLSLYGITLSQLADKLANANRAFVIGQVRQNGKAMPVLAGQTLQGVPDIGLLLLTSRDGRPVYVKDVAEVNVGGAEVERRAWTISFDKGAMNARPAVSISIAKRKGANAVNVSHDIMTRLDLIRKNILPPDVMVEVTRNYGETAREKADELLFHLGLATLSIVVLIVLAVGWREGFVVSSSSFPTTILLTLFASWLMGYTINRVSLFALIFSIGILVDDAIVVVPRISCATGRCAAGAP